MAGTLLVPRVLVAIVVLHCVSTLPRDINYPTADENHLENSESNIHPSSVNNQSPEMLEQVDKPKSCFHFFVSRNMSSLLTEATKMLRTIRDRREREWILTFIYRIKSLAEHLRAHPDSRNYECLPTDDETKKRILSDNVRGQPQPELYFVDDIPKRSNEGEDAPEKIDKTSDDNQEHNSASKEELLNPLTSPKPDSIGTSSDKDSTPSKSKPQILVSTETSSKGNPTDDGYKDISLAKQEDTPVADQQQDVPQAEEGKDVPSKKEKSSDSNIVLSSAPDCDSTVECVRGQVSSSSPQAPRDYYFADAGNIYPQYQSDDVREQDLIPEEVYQQEVLKERIRKALLEELAPEIKKLKTVGGTENDLMSLWNLNFGQDKSPEENEMDFDYEETGAAAGDLNLNEKVQPDRTVAPSLDEVQSSKENVNTAKDSSYEPYDDSDVLVQQLFDVRFNNPPSKTTKSLSDQNNEYLITSTNTPF